MEERVWDHIVRKHGDKTRIAVSELEDSLLAENQALDRNRLVALLKACMAKKLGTFYAGRRGKPSRMVWTAPPRSMSAGAVLGLIVPGAATAATPVQLVTVEIPLRAGVIAKLAAPADLTVTEADRLADFIRKLPAKSS